MRMKVWSALGAVAVVLLMAQMAWAQVAATSEPASRPGRGGRGEWRGWMLDRLIEDLAVTEETAATVRAKFDEFYQATRNWQQENGETLRDLYTALDEAAKAEPKDEAKVKELSEQIAALQKARLALRDNLLAQLKDVLTAEQLEKVKDVVVEWRMRLRMATRNMELTDEQKAKLEEIVKTWESDEGKVVLPEQRNANFRALLEKVVTEVILTDAQRTALAAMTGEEGFYDKVSTLDLTEAQKAQVDQLRRSSERGGRRMRGEGPPPTGGPGEGGRRGPGGPGGMGGPGEGPGGPPPGP